MKKFAYRLEIPVIFPEGVHPGAGSSSNKIIVAKNGKDEPVLRGTSIAGVLRSAYRSINRNKHSFWFGEALDGKENGSASRVKVEDAAFNIKIALPETVHNAHNRHTGAVYESALFSEERIPANAQTVIRLTLPDCEEEVGRIFLAEMVGLFADGLHFGGAIARGMGRAKLNGEAKIKKYDLSSVEGMATWLDDQYKQRQGIEVENLEPFNPDASFGKQNFVVSMTLQIPRGQDFLVSEGADMSPMQRTNVAGEQHWIIPGSTLRGLFRAWFSRLAAKDGKLKYDTHKVPIGKPDLLGWAGKESKDDRKEFQENPDALGDSILSLFGSMYAKGRIHISDAISKQPATTEATQKRMHVAIDRFSGGANEGALFENTVLTSQTGYEFPCVISIAAPKPDDVKYLAQTLTALNLGLIRIGSSKASGRLTVKDFTPDAADKELINMFNNNYKGGK